jgi:hypothetical protein
MQATRHTRVIHQPSDLPEFAHRRLEQSKNFLLTANVRVDRKRSPAPRHNLPNHLFGPSSIRQKINSDRETVGANQPGNRSSDSPARASDKHSSAVLLTPNLIRHLSHFGTIANATEFRKRRGLQQ